MICLCPKLVMRVGNWAIPLCDHHPGSKDPSKYDDLVNRQVMEFSVPSSGRHGSLDGTHAARDHGAAVLPVRHPWFVLAPLASGADFVECLAAGSMVQMVSSAVPLPGRAGGAEGGFYLFYGFMFGSSISAGFLVWRIITFFGPTL